MNKILEAVYGCWAEDYHETEKMEEIYKMLEKPIKNDTKECNDLYSIYACAINEEHQNAFYAGFYSAVDLFMAREGNIK